MKTHYFKGLVPGLFAAAAVAFALNVGAQTPPPPAPPTPPAPPAANSPQAPRPAHHKDSAAAAKRDADMKAECQAMMAKKQEMQDKIQAMDDTLDKLVADMTAVKDSKEVDALEKPMAAVLTEMVAQRKVFHTMMMEMQPAMMQHMMHHMNMHGTKGAMECPMMKTGMAPEPAKSMSKM